MFGWGVITACQGVIQNFGSLVALQFLLGVFEAGLVLGAVYIISMYYKRYELQWRLVSSSAQASWLVHSVVFLHML